MAGSSLGDELVGPFQKGRGGPGDWWIPDEPEMLAWLRGAWTAGVVVPLVCRETVEELLRVLAYPKFRLARIEIDELLGDFLPYAEVVELSHVDWPACRDQGDRVFLALAQQAGADVLLTGDADLLEVADVFPVRILTPAELTQELGLGRAK